MTDHADLWKEYKRAVLERIGDFSLLFEGLAKQRPSTDGWVTALCPFHADKNPSFAFNRKTGQWCCFAGCGKGSAFDFLMQTSGKSFKEALLEIGDRVGVPRPYPDKPPRPPIREALVKQWVGDLWANEEVCRWLREKRGLSDATLKKYEIGWDPKRQRNTIPIRDERGNVMNVRLYNAKKDPKIINYTEGRYKYGSPARLYGIDELVKYQGKQVVLCFAEDTEILTPHGWALLRQLGEDTEVAQYDRASGAITFVRPLARQVFDYHGDMVHLASEWCDLLLTPDHRMLSRYGGHRPVVLSAAAISRGRCLPVAGELSGEPGHEPTEPEVRLLVALAADGCVEARGRKTLWNLKKSRKKDRLQRLLSALRIPWTERVYPSSPAWTVFVVDTADLSPVTEWSPSKRLPWAALRWSQSARRALIEELAHWDGDGSGNSIRFFTHEKDQADLVAAVGAVTGYGAIQRVDRRRGSVNYVVNLIRRSWRRLAHEPREVPYSGKVFCCTVPTGFIVVRRNGKTTVAGNCEGEWDRLILQQEGFMAVTGTHGASVFRPEWIAHFKDKDVVVLYDCDREGQAAASNVVLRALKTSGAASVKNVVLPLKGDKDDKDVTDYFHKRGLTAADLQKLIDETPAHSYEAEDRPEEILTLESFTEIERKDLIDKKVRCEITVCGETSEAFHAVEEFRVTFCPRMQKGGCFECHGAVEPAVIPKGAQEYIGSCMSTNVQLKAMLREYACRYGQKPTIEILRRTTVKEFFCHQKVNRITQTRDEQGNVVQVIDGKKQELLEKRVYYLSSEHPKPGNYLAVGWVKSHPKTQQVTFLIESMEPLEDDFESFRVEENLQHLRAFQSLSWAEILADLTENVTRVYEREEILVAVLLTYCSPRWIPFNDEIIRGWLVTIIIGDSGSGKTQTHQRIAEFINIGDCFSGLTGSRTGLAYALVEHKQKGWQVRIGRYPANSRKILTVDEAQHLPDWDLRTISKAMEEGFLQIDRVQSKGYESQTRLIMIANPKKDMVMDSFSFGCESLTTILPPTIIRRTDVAVFANSGDLKDLSFINRRRTEGNRRRITPEMLRAVVYWAWNLRPEQIIFTSEAEDYCLKRAQELSEVYGYAVDVPLITLSDCRNNLARVAAAFAALLVSADEKFSRLVVEPKHVHMAAEFLCRIYSNENCALDDYSEISRHGSQLLDYEQIEKAFLKKWEQQRFAHDEEERNHFPRLLFVLRTTRVIRREDLAEQVGCGIDTVKRAVRLLKRFNLLDTTRDGYMKKPKFNKFLRRFLKAHPEFFADAAWGGVQPQNESNSLGLRDLSENGVEGCPRAEKNEATLE